MAISAQNLNNRSYHKVNRLVTIFARITGAADIGLNGYTINYGNDLIASATRSAEGRLRIITKFPWRELVGVSALLNNNTTLATYVSDTPSTQTVLIGFDAFADGTTDTDPDGAVIFLRLDFNISAVGVK
jgi:hypothetical protein